MKLQQIYKILKVAFIATLLMFLFELLFSIDAIATGLELFVININTLNLTWLLFTVIWIIMFVQVCFIPIPAYIVLNAAVATGIINNSVSLFKLFSLANTWIFITVVLSSYMAGAIVAYFMGLKWGDKAAKWCAGSVEEYQKWSDVLNNKGKWWYAATVILPVFPDDLLCLIAGSVRFDFKFFVISNIIGRGVGLIFMIGALLLLNQTNNAGISITTIAWGVACLLELIALFIMRRKIVKNN